MDEYLILFQLLFRLKLIHIILEVRHLFYLRLNPIDIVHRSDIAVADDGNLHRGFDLGDGSPIGFAVVGLDLRATMHGDGAGSVIFQDVRHFQIIARLIVPAQPDFSGDGHGQRFGQPIEQLGDFVRRAQQACARAALTDLRHRTAHVDVDGAGVQAFDDALALRDQPIDIVIEQLARDRAFVLCELEILPRAVIVVAQAIGRDEFGVGHGRTQLAADRAKGFVAEARHRRQDQIAVDGNLANVESGLRSGIQHG